MMEPGDIYSNDDIGVHVLILRTDHPYDRWCESYIFELKQKTIYMISDLEGEFYGWRKIS